MLQSSFGFHFDKPFDRTVWMARLSQTIGAVLGGVQFSMVLFTDAYVPYWLRSRVVSRERRERRKQRSAADASPQLRPPDLELQPVDGVPPTYTQPAALASARRDAHRDVSPLRSRSSTSSSDLSYVTSGRMSDLLYEAQMAPYTPLLDYAGIAIQFGYVTQFSVVWPLAPFVCILHTMFRLRSNTLRLTNCSMRALPEAVNSIGLWQPLLMFEAWMCVLINCLIVSVSTDQLDYISCWTHTLFREKGDCISGNVPMTSRFLIAVAAEHVVLAMIFLINAMVPEKPGELQVWNRPVEPPRASAPRVTDPCDRPAPRRAQTRVKRAAFQFKKRYMAEQMMDQPAQPAPAPTTTNPSLRLRSGGNPSTFKPSSVDYDGAWHSGSDLSDSYETAEAEDVAAMRSAGFCNSAAAATPAAADGAPAHAGPQSEPAPQHYSL